MRDPVALEFDLSAGRRGERDDHVRGFLCALTGAPRTRQALVGSLRLDPPGVSLWGFGTQRRKADRREERDIAHNMR
jgi:L-seryl-tRNA selenium transferase